MTGERFLWLGKKRGISISWLPMPPFMHNHGLYVGSLADLCRWLAKQAEDSGEIEIADAIWQELTTFVNG